MNQTYTSVPQVREQEGVPVISLGRTLEDGQANELANQLDMILRAGRRWVIIDAADVQFMSSAGVGSIFSRIKKFRRLAGDIILCNLSDEVMYVLKELDVADYMTIRSGVDNALSECKNQ